MQWTLTSWQRKQYAQKVEYADPIEVDAVLTQLTQLPSLVTVPEVDCLKQQLADAALGERFVLQGGDCAESFSDCNESSIVNNFKILLQMSLILIHGLQKPVTRIGRIAGQYAKPRTAAFETRSDLTLASYRGDLINGVEFSAKAREADPKRLLEAYYRSGLTLNYIRSLVGGGFADLHHPENWQLDFVDHAMLSSQYQVLAEVATKTLPFVKTIEGVNTQSLDRVDFFTSHEALHLPYEQALVKKDREGRHYLLSTHFPWLGMRTAQLDGAHVEFFRGIANPIAVKVGPSMQPTELQALVECLNPQNEPGHLTLITRLGEKQIKHTLPGFIQAVQATGKSVLWSCDPMHGNTHTTDAGLKTRHFDDILSELRDSFHIHAAHQSVLGGVHFELTGHDVTECTGGARGVAGADLFKAYKSLVDPRLNYEQSLEMAMLIAAK